MIGFGQRCSEHRQERPRDKHKLRAGVFQHVRIVIRVEQRIHRHWNDSSEHRPEKAHRPVVAVMHEQEHALFPAQSECTQTRCHATDAVLEFPIAEDSQVVDKGRLRVPPEVAFEQMLRKVEAFARGTGFGHFRM